jgi:hypothetical protein
MVIITKDGVFFELTEVDEEGNETVKTLDILATTLGIVSYLTFPATIDTGVTVKDIMNILAMNKDGTDFLFDSSLGGHPFSTFLDEMTHEAEKDQMFSWMEIAHEIDPISDEDPELFSVARMRGVGNNRELFSVEFSPVAAYMNMEVKLNDGYVVRKISAEKETIVLSCTKSFTLFDVIHAVLFEMSYYGDSDARKVVLAEVLESLGVDSINGFKLTDRDDIEKLKKELQKLIEAEDYEEAAKLRDKIKRMLSSDAEQSEN